MSMNQRAHHEREGTFILPEQCTMARLKQSPESLWLTAPQSKGIQPGSNQSKDKQGALIIASPGGTCHTTHVTEEPSTKITNQPEIAKSINNICIVAMLSSFHLINTL